MVRHGLLHLHLTLHVESLLSASFMIFMVATPRRTETLVGLVNYTGISPELYAERPSFAALH